jgi:CubicO group peptidase (beta-lactamase class C family)
MRTLSFFILLIGLIFTGNLKGTAQGKKSESSISDKADQYLDALTKLNRFSGSVLMAKNGGLIFNHSYGFADQEHDVLNQTTTKYRIASVTKQFTAMAILMLQEQKKLNVEDSICKYLTNCPVIWKEITINHLLTMSSGIPDYTDFPAYNRTKMMPVTLSEFINTFKDKKLIFMPGEKFEYSNSNYILLGQIIENITGKLYKQFLQEKIFDPLQMNNTGLYDEHTILKHKAEGYIVQKDIFQNANGASFLNGYSAGGMYSTMEDLLKWDQSLYSTKLVSPASIEKLFTPFKGDYAYGWFTEKKFNRKWVNHTGAIPGFRSQISRFPDDKLTIIVLSNLDNTNIESVTQDLAAIVFGEGYELPKAHIRIKTDTIIYSDYVGAYDFFPNTQYTVSIEKGILTGSLHGRKAEMIPFSPSEFYIKDYDIEIRFLRNNEGKVDSFIWDKMTTVKKIN